MCPLKNFVYRSRASCLVRIRLCLNPIFNTTFHLSQFLHTFHFFSCHLAMTTKYHPVHRQQDCLVVWPYSPLSGCEPKAIAEISSTNVTPIHHPSGRTSFCSVNNSGEDATFAPMSSEMEERQSIGRLASPLPMQEREASAIPARIYHSTGESSVPRSSQNSKHGETYDTPTQTEDDQRHKRRTGETCHK